MPPKYRVVEKHVQGFVRWFNPSANCGRISTENHGEIFVHANHIRQNYCGDRELSRNQRVTFNLVRGPRGLQANKVKVDQYEYRASRRDRRRSPSIASSNSSRSSSPYSTYSVASSSVFDCDAFSQGKDDDFQLDLIDTDLRGEVKKFDSKRGYGFIYIRRYGSIFCHVSRINSQEPSASQICLKPTQFVKCDVGRNRKGKFAAMNVQVISDALPHKSGHVAASTSGVTTSDRDQSVDTANDYLAVGELGEVIFYNGNRNFGFIQVQGYAEKVFVHRTGLKSVSELRRRQIVKCDLVRDQKNMKAVNVVVVGGGGAKQMSSPTSIDTPSDSSKRPSASLCDICKDSLEDPVTIPCNHIFCQECLQEWLRFNSSCPLDGRAVSTKSMKKLL